MPIELRPWQVEALGRLSRARGRFIALGMPTGSGKTLTALYAAYTVFNSDLTIYLLRTINEEGVVWHEYNALRGGGITNSDISTLHGKRHFCPREFIDEGEPVMKCGNCPLYKNLINDASAHCTGILNSGDERECIDDVLDGWSIKLLKSMRSIDPTTADINEAYLTVLGLKPPSEVNGKWAGDCSYTVMIGTVKYAGLVVGNYNYLLHPGVKVLKGIAEAARNPLIIIDEAHNLDGLPDAYSRRISPVRLREMASGITELCRRYNCGRIEGAVRPDTLTPLINGIANKLEELFKRSASGFKVGENAPVVDIENIARLVDEAATLLAPYLELEVNEADVKALRVINRIGRFIDSKVMLDNYVAGRLRGYGAYIHVGKKGPSMWLMPILPKYVYGELLNELHNATWLLMSGTLPSVEYIRRVYGFPIHDDDYIIINARIGRINSVRIIDTVSSRYSERGDETFRNYAGIIANIVGGSHPGIVLLVVYPSYEFMNSVLRYLNLNGVAVALTEGVVKSLKAVRDEAVRIVEGGGRVVLNAVAGGRFTEGVEIRHNGESLIKAVIIAGVPYPNFRDTALQDRARESGLGEAWFEQRAVVNIMQAIGRSIRSRNDTVDIILIDERFRWFARRLPLLKAN